MRCVADSVSVSDGYFYWGGADFFSTKTTAINRFSRI